MRVKQRGYGLLWLVVGLVAAVLAGCGGGADSNGVSGTALPTEVVQAGLPATGGEEAAPTAQGDLLILETPVLQGTPEAVGEAASAGDLPGAILRGGGEQVGTVWGAMLDVASGTARYLVANVGPEDAPDLVLIPRGLLKIARTAPEKEPGEASAEEDFAAVEFNLDDGVAVSQGQAKDALPRLDPQALESWQETGALPEGWDGAARKFWAANLLDERMSGEESSEGPVFYVGQAQPGGDLFAPPLWKVNGEGGEALGRIVELFFDAQGKTLFAALELPEFRGQEDLSVVVPWDRLVWAAEKQAFTVAASLEELAGAPLFDREALPDLTVPGWEQEWLAYWQAERAGSSQAPTAPPQVGQVRASQLIGTVLHDAAGEEIGPVEDFILGPDGNILYLVLRIGDQSVPVPWMTFDYADERMIYIDDITRLMEAPGYDSAEGIDPTQADWDKELRSYWGLGR